MIALDTHVLLWWALDPPKLSPKARKMLRAMEEKGGYVSSISFWELGQKIKRGKLQMGIGIEEFARRIERSGTLDVIPVDTTIWLTSLALPWPHRDPADRIIVATALMKGVPLLSKDRNIKQFDGIDVVW